MRFITEGAAFSPHCIDKGTLAMLSHVTVSCGDKVLDLGCGYGAVGIYLAKLIGENKVFMSDVDKKCIALARQNAALNDVSGINISISDGFKTLDEKDFSLILSNPPYHADFSIPKHFIEKGFNRLRMGGRIYMVTKRKDWYKNKLAAIFGGVSVYEAEGYYVFYAEKRGFRYANKS